jgi:hypothetical protein
VLAIVGTPAGTACSDPGGDLCGAGRFGCCGALRAIAALAAAQGSVAAHLLAVQLAVQ